MSPAPSTRRPSMTQRARAGLHHHAVGQAAHRTRGAERDALVDRLGRIAPDVLGHDREPERLARDRQRGPDRLPARDRAGHEVERRMRELAELVGRERIDRGAQLDARLAVGLQPVAGRALPAVAEPHRDGVALAQVAAADPDQDGVRPRPDVEAVEPVFELGAVARLDRGVVRGGGLVELRLAHVRGGAPRDLQHAGVVDAELARRVDDGQLLVGAGDERAGRREHRGAHVLGQIGRIRHRGRDLAGGVGRVSRGRMRAGALR